jgi:glycosyltransferase involved in cell wall biosynthesis
MTEQRKRVAIFLNTPVSPERKEQIRTGAMPRHDILLLRERLNARLIEPKKPIGYGRFGSIGRFWQLFSSAWLAWRRRKDYDVIVMDLDGIGVFLALLFKLFRTKKGHVLICHGKLSGGYGAKLLRMFNLQRHINYFVCYGPAVARRFVEVVGVPEEQVKLVRHPADHHWWKPSDRTPEPLISSAGLLVRDYATLAQAVRDLDVQVQIAAYSPWVDPAKQPAGGAPDNVKFTRLPQNELRDLYDRSMFVVVPLIPTSGQAGSLVIYESMAMGKAVIVAETEGELALQLVTEGETGLYYQPGDVEGLRSAIKRLLDNPDEAKRMGEAGRARVERELNMDRYVDEMAALVSSLTGDKYPAAQPVSDTSAAD